MDTIDVDNSYSFIQLSSVIVIMLVIWWFQKTICFKQIRLFDFSGIQLQ